MLENIAQRLSRLWARVANLNELPGNSNKCGALPLVSLNARHKMNPPHRKSQPMWRNHSFHLSGQYSLDGISPKSFVWYALAGPWRNAETFAKDLR